MIAKHPCFSQLNDNELSDFVSLFVEKKMPAGSVIVQQHDLVDSIYFIASGAAEVQVSGAPIATLSETEVIGLNDTGFYSTTGERTATVIALTDMILLRLDIAALYEFFKTHEHANQLMRDNLEIIMRMNLIKHAVPFSHLTMEQIQWLAKQVKLVTYRAGEIIFQKGDQGEQCYLIRSGKVEIFLPNSDQTESRVAVLKSLHVFGEASLLMDAPRNASARALKDCELFALNRDVLLTVVKTEKNVAESLMILLKSRGRPKWLSHIDLHTHQTDDQETLVTLRDATHNNYYRLTQEGFFIWQKLDGKHTLRDISLAFHQQYDIFDPGMISKFILDLEESGFVEKTYSHWLEQKKDENIFIRAISLLKRVMEASVSFGNVDEWLTKVYQQWAHVLFGVRAQVTFAFLVIVGCVAFLFVFEQNVEFLRVTHYSSSLLIAAMFTAFFTAILHELAHAFTAKAFDKKVHSFGVGWYWFGPIAFCDTSDMWLSSRWPRVAVDLSGIYLDMLLAGLSAVLALCFLHYPTLSLFFWLFAFVKYLGVFSNLDPMLELDGYYTLMDLFGKDNLRQSAILWLAEELPQSWKDPRKFLQHKIEIAYWLICIIYLAMAVVLPYIVLNILLYGLIGVQNPYVALIGPILVVFFSGLGIWQEVQKAKV